jgi:hypothetical protein
MLTEVAPAENPLRSSYAAIQRRGLCWLSSRMEAFVEEAVDKEARRRETAVVEGSFAAAREDTHDAALKEAAIVRYMEDTAHKEEVCLDYGMAEEGIVVEGNSSRDMVACNHYTSGLLEGTVDSGCNSAADPYLVAYSAALPADDDCSSCRLGKEMLPHRSRARSTAAR